MSRPPFGLFRVPAGPVVRVLAAALLAAFTAAHAAKNEAKMEKRDLRREMAGGSEDTGRKPGRGDRDRKSTRLNSSHVSESRMPSSA